MNPHASSTQEEGRCYLDFAQEEIDAQRLKDLPSSPSQEDESQGLTLRNRSLLTSLVTEMQINTAR